MNIIITYRNGESDVFEEKQLDNSKLTMMGHTSALIAAWEKEAKGVYKIDNYNSILLDEVISVRYVAKV